MLTRRQYLLYTSIGTVAASPWMQSLMAAMKDERVLAIFTHGVASGEPQADSVLLWTRVNPDNELAEVKWQLATDAAFNHLVQQGIVHTGKDRDFIVKPHVKGLQAGQQYYYRFSYQGQYSETGRTRTLPQGNLDTACIAVVSCSNFPFGYFNAYDAIARDDNVQFVVHLGDYIYEYGPDGFGGEQGAELGRAHLPPREIVSLDDYRQRHAQYKRDPASRLMHAAHPLIPTWDDHESTNNPYKEGAQNHQANEGLWTERRDASLQAYYEWMPVHDPKPGDPAGSLWRHFELGDLLSLTTLETRHTGRDKQIDYAEHLPNINNAADRRHFVQNVLNDKQRQMLSPDMQHFLHQRLKGCVEHGRPWQIIANQIPMARTHVPPLQDLIQTPHLKEDDPLADERRALLALGQHNLPLYLDTWDGYPAARETFYELCKKAGADSLLVLTGDSHSFWANQLFDQQGQAMGIELGTAGVTSPGDFEYFGQAVAAEVDRRLVSHNREVLWTDGLHQGYILLRVQRDQAQADYISVSTVSSPRYSTRRLKALQLSRNSYGIEAHLK